MRGKWGTVWALAVVIPVLGYASGDCGTGDNPPCSPAPLECTGAFCNDSVYTSANPDPSLTDAPGGEYHRQLYVVRELASGTNGGGCTAADNYAAPEAPARLNSFKYVGEAMGQPSFVMAASLCPPFCTPSNTGKIGGLAAGTYRAEYCIVINNDGGDNIKRVRPVLQVFNASGIVNHFGKTHALQLEEGNQQICDTAMFTLQGGEQVGMSYFKGGTRDANYQRCRGAAAGMTTQKEVYDSLKLFLLAGPSP